MTQTAIEQTQTFPVGAEVTITVTGRVIHSGSRGRLVVEYLRANGFADRTAFDTTAPSVTVAAAPPPSATELARREQAARMVACASLDLEEGVGAHQEWVDRFNDAYPVGAEVRFSPDRHTSAGSVVTRISEPAVMYAERIASIRIDGVDGPVVLQAIEPITEPKE